MKLIQRIGYYLGGFSIGLVLLAFFLNGKKVSCDYGPEARVLKNIRTKKLMLSDNALNQAFNIDLDTSSIKNILLNGDVDFSESDTRKKPCGVFHINSTLNDSDIILMIENCDSLATVQEIK